MKKYTQYIGIAVCLIVIAIAVVIGVRNSMVEPTVMSVTPGEVETTKMPETTELTIEGATQPDVENDILCYDYVNGCAYSCYYKEDGNVQLRINPEGNLVFSKVLSLDEMEPGSIADEAEQVDAENDILCYDYARGCVYACFVRDDGNIQMRIGFDGGLAVVASADSNAVSLYNLYSERAE